MPGIYVMSCSWCHATNDVAKGPTFCETCGHRADLPRVDCDCPKCWKPDDARPVVRATPEHAAGLELARELVAVENQRDALLAVVREVADLGERLLTGDLDPRVPPRYVGSFRLAELIANARAAIAKAEGR